MLLIKNTLISSIENTIKKLHVQSDLRLIYKKNLYNDKQKEIDELFGKYHIPLLNDPGHPAFIEEWKQNIDSAYYEKIKTKM